jgi:molecular chaperone GrpE
MSKQHEKKHHHEAAEPEKHVPAETETAAEAAPAGAAAEEPKKTAAEESDPAIELKARIASLEAENSNLKDQYLRKAADFENFRKRMNKEKQDAIDFANQTLLLDLIPVIDDFERAIKSSEAARDYDTLHEGIALIEKRLVSQLEAKWGLVRFNSAGTAFDPNRHEAIMMDKSSEVTEATVSEDFVRGYTLKDRVIRSAKVKVLMPADEPKNEGSSAENASSSVTNDGQN